MRFVFWALLCANALLFAYGRGMLGKVGAEQHEPARLQQQLAPGKLVLLSAAQAQAIAAAAAAPPDSAASAASADDTTTDATPVVALAAPEAAPATAAPLLACLETDALSSAEARRFETRLERLDLGARQTRLTLPFQEVTNHLVYLAPQGGKEGAERRVAELRAHGITNFFVMQGEPAMRWGVSLGAFKTEASARKLVAELSKKGVPNARILARGPQSQRNAYRFRDIDTEQRQRIVDAGRGIAAARLHRCRVDEAGSAD